MIDAIVKRHVVGEIIEVPLFSFRRRNRTGHLPNPEDALIVVRLADSFRRRIRAIAAAGNPHHDEELSILVDDFGDGHVAWLDEFALIQHVLEIGIDSVLGDSRQILDAGVVLGDTYDKVPAAPVVDVVGEGADSFQRCLWILGRLELDTLRFHDASIEQGLETGG